MRRGNGKKEIEQEMTKQNGAMDKFLKSNGDIALSSHSAIENELSDCGRLSSQNEINSDTVTDSNLSGMKIKFGYIIFKF